MAGQCPALSLRLSRRGIVLSQGQPVLGSLLAEKVSARPAHSIGYATVSREQNVPGERYWSKIPRWQDVPTAEFLSHQWQTSKSIHRLRDLVEFMGSVLPEDLPPQKPLRGHSEYEDIETRESFVQNVRSAVEAAPMAFRLSPHILSVINWNDPLNDPIRRQFIPLKSSINVTHPGCSLDPLQESGLSPVPGLVHRYPNKALFLTTSVCPVYCRFCTRSYSVGTETETVKKMRFLPLLKQWEPRFAYIESTPQLHDIVLSGGDTYLLEPDQIRFLGERLLSIPHIKRLRFATKGLGVSPSRLIDPNDSWIPTVIELNKKARKMGKHVCIHTHINCKQEITWILRKGAQRLYEEGVTVRNQTVLLNGVNNTFESMGELIHALGEMNIEPYYVYQGDMIPGAEDLWTPLSDSHDLELQLRDQTAGFLLPRFVCDVPIAGKRPSLSAENYDKRRGVAEFTAPVLQGRRMKYWDPLWSLSEEEQESVRTYFRTQI